MGRGKGKGGKGGGGEGEEEVKVERPWLIRNLETGKSGLYVEERTPGGGKKFKRLGKAKGGDKDN